MLFTDPIFLFYFLPVSLLLLHVAARGHKFYFPAKIVIIGSTLVFYAYQNWTWPLLFLLIVSITWLCSWAINRTGKAGWRLGWLIASVTLCFLALFLFKFSNWLAAIIPFLQPVQRYAAAIFGHDGVIILPPGISFYVFEAVSFTIDQYRRKISLPKPLDYLTFLAMFPRFVAGPIVRYSEVHQQLLAWSGLKLSRGLTLFAIGFMIKLLGADQFAVFVPYAFDVPHPDMAQAWAGTLAYTFQLYLDFWGYSLMATGLGLCLGFEFPDNFRSPYSADSIGEFWRRWHITLSSWIRDYLYISFGGNRGALGRTCANLLLAMALAGLWHGANFTFLIWGVYHGALLALERILGERRLAIIPRPWRICLSFLLVVLGWVLFRSTSFDQARSVYMGLLGTNGIWDNFNPLFITKNGFAAVLCTFGLIFVVFFERRLVFSIPIAARDYSFRSQVMVGLGFLLALIVNASSVKIPFLYFQF